MPLNESKVKHPSPLSGKQSSACLLLLLFAFLFPLHCSAGNGFAISDEHHPSDLRHHLAILLDEEKVLSSQDLTKPEITRQFVPFNPLIFPSSKNTKRAWLKFRIQNKQAKKANFWLTIAGASRGNVELYQLSSSTLLTSTQSPIDEQAPIKKIELDALESRDYFLCLDNINLKHLDIHLSEPASFIEQKLKHQQWFDFSYAAFVTVLVISLLFFISNSNRAFLYLGGYIITIITVQNTAFQQTDGNIRASLHTEHVSFYPMVFLAFAFTLLSFYVYSKQQGVKPKIKSSFIVILLLFYILSGMSLTYLNISHSFLWAFALTLLTMPIYMLYYCYQKTKDPITLFLIISRIVIATLLVAPVIAPENNYHLSNTISPFSLFLINFDTLCLFAAFYLSHINNEENRVRQQLLSKELPNHSRELLNKLLNELKTPLNAIQASSDALSNHKSGNEQQELFEIISSSTKGMIHQISELSWLADNEAGRSNNKLPLEIRALLEECLAANRELLKGKNIDIITDLDDDIPQILEGNVNHLRQIINTLLVNAINHTQQGIINLSAYRLSDKPEKITFTFSDTGRGIDKNTLHELSSPKNSSEHESISLVKILLSQLHSKLEISSQLGEGSEFKFTLSLPESKLSQSITAKDYSIIKGKQFLIINNNHSFSHILKLQTQHWGASALECNDGTEAIALFRAKKNINEKFHVIILDDNLPNISSVELAQRITEESDEKPIIILLSSNINSINNTVRRHSGIDIILEKPVSQRILKNTIANLLQSPPDLNTPGLRQDMRILVAEDNDVSRRVLDKMLDSLHINYKIVSDGKLATDAALRERFDLILMDCEMPIMDGFEATQVIHKHQKHVNQIETPVIALTAHVFDENKQKSFDAGMVGFLEKPIQMSDLIELLEQYS